MDGKPGSIISPPLKTETPPAAPRIKTFKCPGCGNPLATRGMEQTESIACEACGSVIDLTDENFRILSTYQSKMIHKPLIPLGSRGQIRGETLEMIGYMRRALTVEGVDYEWSEYLLFNPYQGFRWLSEYNGHWNFIKTTRDIPKMTKSGPRPVVTYLGQVFRHFQTAEARVVFVVGEFTWKVRLGETARISDYISPPLILSREKSDQEAVWSLGEYIEPETLQKAFHLKTPLPPKTGVAPNQPSPYARTSSALMTMLGYFLVIALGIHFGLIFLAQNKLVYENQFLFRQADKEKALITDFFTVAGHASNLVVKSTAGVNNGWIYLHMSLVNEEGRAYDFGREISYYHGAEGGERWTEGGTFDEAILPGVPAGRYYLLIEPESSAPRVQYTIQVYRDVPQWTSFFLALGALCVIPFFMKLRAGRFEASRWSESDPAKAGED